MLVIKRDGSVIDFDSTRISKAISYCGNFSDAALAHLTKAVIKEITPIQESRGSVDVETVQDIVENVLMLEGFCREAKHYILYRNQRAQARQLEHVDIRKYLSKTALGLANVDVESLVQEVADSSYGEISGSEMSELMLLTARAKIEIDPDYDILTARILLSQIYKEIFIEDAESEYSKGFVHYITEGVEKGYLDPRLLNFNLHQLAYELEQERDELFKYFGLQTLYDRYLLRIDGELAETPQYFWMRIAMGLAINDIEKVKDFYDIISQMFYIPGTPTLFNAGTTHPQLSSCFLLTTSDDIEGIFKTISDDAKLSKWAGGLGNDWTPIRSTGATIKGTKGKSSGVIPFLKVCNDTAVAVNQGGRRPGALCSYLETWHLDIEDFLDLRRNTGDERRRTHDMNTANWIPDLFMKRVEEGGQWTLFSPDDVPGLHDLYGAAFERAYKAYENQVDEGKIKLYKRISAVELWRKMLTRLFETGHPWITFKDPCNVRSPQDHVGVVHSSNLCTEITLNTSNKETAVCNLGSVNLPRFIDGDGKIKEVLLRQVVHTAMRMLDNVIDINFYPIPEARAANTAHRAVGLGMMGFHDALAMKKISYSSQEAIMFADSSMELISYYAIQASCKLAKERGTYSTYRGSKWDRGLLPIDTISLLEDERNQKINVHKYATIDWSVLRRQIEQYGMRNSNCLAIAPTATISNIAGSSQSIEPMYANLYVKSNLSGEFTVINELLIKDLKSVGMWTQDVIDALKYHDGSLREIVGIPADIRLRYQTAFEIEPKWLIWCAAARQKWIDQGQSLNLYMEKPTGKQLHNMYMLAWKCGLKTTYYLRSKAATQIEKSSVDINKFGIQPKWMKNQSASSCSIDGSCESCQ